MELVSEDMVIAGADPCQALGAGKVFNKPCLECFLWEVPCGFYSGPLSRRCPEGGNCFRSCVYVVLISQHSHLQSEDRVPRQLQD
jgi:hypothetical protein